MKPEEHNKVFNRVNGLLKLKQAMTLENLISAGIETAEIIEHGNTGYGYRAITVAVGGTKFFIDIDEGEIVDVDVDVDVN